MHFTFLINDCLLNGNGFCYIKYDFGIMGIITLVVACVPFIILYFTQKAEKKRERAKKCEEMLIRINNLQTKISDFMQKWFGGDDLFINQYLVAQTFEDIEPFKTDFLEIQNYYYEEDNILDIQFSLYLSNIKSDYKNCFRKISNILFPINLYIIDIKIINLYHKKFMNAYLQNKEDENNIYTKINKDYSEFLMLKVDLKEKIKKMTQKFLS